MSRAAPFTFRPKAVEAIADAFGRSPEWTEAILEPAPSLVGGARAIARFHLPDDAPVCNLDDAALLQSLDLRPSDVVSRDDARSRAWARKIYEPRRWWASFGLWNLTRLRLEDEAPAIG
jgi:hypothetical protein